MQAVKTRDLPITGLRLAPELKAALQREANINGVSLNRECEARLQASLVKQRKGEASGPDFVVMEPGGNAALMVEAKTYAAEDGHERMLLSHYRALPAEKQLALLTFIRR